MIYAFTDAICRVMRGVHGAVVMARWARRHNTNWPETAKASLASLQLLRAPHVEELTARDAIAVVRKARAHGVEPFDLWMVFNTYDCDDLDHAVTKVLEMKELYAIEREPSELD